MFFNSKKVDSKIRFQRRAFKQQLRQARSFKREPIRTSQNSSFLEKFSLKTKILFPIFFFTGFYLIFLPNFFTIKNTIITGLESKQTQTVKAILSEYLLQPGAIPKNNLLWLSQKNLSNYILKNDPGALAIASIKKRYPNTLLIDFSPNKPIFFAISPQENFIIYSDQSIYPATSTSSKENNLTIIKINSFQGAASDTHYQNLDQLSAFTTIQNKFSALTGQQVSYFSVEDQQQSIIKVTVPSGAIYIFDYKQDLSASLEQLRLLLSSIDPKDAKNLAYIDMSVKNRGYICLKNTPCATQKALPQTTVSGTASSTLPNLTQ